MLREVETSWPIIACNCQVGHLSIPVVDPSVLHGVIWDIAEEKSVSGLAKMTTLVSQVTVRTREVTVGFEGSSSSNLHQITRIVRYS